MQVDVAMALVSKGVFCILYFEWRLHTDVDVGF
jgi:hypothetical protein